MSGRELWYLTRGTGVVSLLLFTAVVVLGVLSSARWSSPRLPRFVVGGLHRSLTLLSLVFIALHVLTTVADGFAPIGHGVIPFRSPYRPVWLGLGAVAFDLFLALLLTSLVRERIGLRAWRALHWCAYAAWPLALVHSLGTGTDARAGWLVLISIACTGLVGAAVLWRLRVDRGADPRARLAGGLATVAVPLAVLIWYTTGPLQHGWARRAGTPRSLLSRSTPSRGKP